MPVVNDERGPQSSTQQRRAPLTHDGMNIHLHTYLSLFIYLLYLYICVYCMFLVDMVSLGAAQLWGDSDWAMVPLQLDHNLSSATATAHATATAFLKHGSDRGGGGRLGEKVAEEEIRRLSVERSFLLNK